MNSGIPAEAWRCAAAASEGLLSLLLCTEPCLPARLLQGGCACCQEAEDRGQVGAPPRSRVSVSLMMACHLQAGRDAAQ